MDSGSSGARGSVALITGAGSGIGRAISRALGAAGYHLVLAGRNTYSLEGTARTIGSDREVTCVKTDVTQPESVARLFETIRQKHQRLDLLINNAGIFGPNCSIPDIGIDDWRATIDTNLTGSFLCAQHAFKLMREQSPQGGRIINNGSLSSYVPRPYATAYTVSKHAIVGLTKALALEGRSYNIACGQIDVGNATTDMMNEIRDVNAGMLQADLSLKVEPTIDVAAVAATVLHMSSLPLSANILFCTAMATQMPFVGRG
jgi:NAD(P)-dependent dehydrogenase (short-subunit alcohol dehydrogenase family)